MIEPRRHATPEEVQAILARARQMRSEYLAALLVSATLRARQHFINMREDRRGEGRRFYQDCA